MWNVRGFVCALVFFARLDYVCRSGYTKSAMPSTKPPALGDQELSLLQYINDRNEPVTVREAAQKWGEPQGLARTTVLTVMERLRQKNYLQRDRSATEAAFAYRPVVQKGDLMRSLVAGFVQKTLGGSVAPFVAYLTDVTDSGTLSEAEQTELRRLVESLDSAEAEPEKKS